MRPDSYHMSKIKGLVPCDKSATSYINIGLKTVLWDFYIGCIYVSDFAGK